MFKHNFIFIGILTVCMSLSAQNPIRTTFSVEMLNDEGGTEIQNISSFDKISFNFIGGRGTVYNEFTRQYTEEENQDLYGMAYAFTYNSGKIMATTSGEFLVDRNDFGYCISKSPHPEVSEDIIDVPQTVYIYWYGMVNGYYVDFDMLGYNDEQKSYTLSCRNVPADKIPYDELYFADLKNLEYMTTYYVRPFVYLRGEIMYGGEMTFTTPRTIEGALVNEPDLKEWCYLDENTHVTLSTKALKSLLDGDEEVSRGMQEGVKYDLKHFLTDDMLSTLKAGSQKTIECTGGDLYVVDVIPNEMLEDFKEYLNEGVVFSPHELVIPVDEKLPSSGGDVNVTKNVGEIETIQCNPEWGVPYDTFVRFNASSRVNTYFGIRIPKYLTPQTYTVYAVVVLPDMEEDTRVYNFRGWMWEQDANGWYPSVGTVLRDKEDKNTFESEFVRCDTICLGEYTFNGNPESVIQFASVVPTSARNKYNTNMCVSQIQIIPKKDESR